MSISPKTYERSWDVHAWVGVVAGLFLTVIFGTGAVVVFHDDIETWQDPAAQAPAPETDIQRWTRLALDAFGGEIPAQFTLWMPEGERGLPKVGYFDRQTGRYVEEWIDPSSGQVRRKREKLGTLLYHVHTLYDVRFTALYYFAGVLALVMLLVLVTGVVIQWDDLVDQFHQFRAGADPFVRWNDLHKVVAYSAAIIVLAPFFVNAVAGPVFEGSRGAAKEATYGRLPPPSAGEAEAPSDPVAIGALVSEARRAVPGLEIGKVIFRNWGRPGARVDVEGGVNGDRFGHAIVRLDPADGEVVRALPPNQQTWAGDLRRWMAEIHSVHFGGFAIEVLFALLSLAVAGSMLAGMVVWFARRRRQRDSAVDWILEKLTAGVGTGTIVAIAAVFAGSRLWPWEMQGRLWAEEMTHYLAFATCVGAAFAVSNIVRYWRVQLGIAGLLLAVTPVLALRHSSAGAMGLLVSERAEVVPAVLGVDLGLLLAGGVLLTCAVWIDGTAAQSREAS
ncbi:MAG: PepSY-associated TM helix domain-containing protein [Bradymonadaceae bacterium]